MNNKVTVTGMEVTTKVSSNLMIAGDTLAGTAKKADSEFKNALDTTVTGALQPVSTIDGINYYYTANNNVTADGKVVEETYVKYNPDNKADFIANSTADAVGYVDYVYQLKAVNSNTADSEFINLNTLNLAYRGDDALNGLNAFRVAIFTCKYDTAFEADLADYNVVLMKNSAAANFTATQAVGDSDEDDEATLEDVTYASFAPIEVAAGETEYYKVVVRMWIEGEDTSCNNTTFTKLTDKFELDMEWTMTVAADKATKTNITNSSYTILKTTAIASDATSVNGTDYYAVTGVTYNGKQVYADKPLTEAGVKLVVAGGTGEADTEASAVVVTGNFNLI